MSLLDQTLANLAPGITYSRDLPGKYNSKWGLAIYYLPMDGFVPQAPGVVLGEALAARSGLGCTLLEGIPLKIPDGAVIVGAYADIKAHRPELVADIPEPRNPGQYAIKLGKSALVTAASIDGLVAGMQTMAMIVLRHPENLIPGSLVMDTPLCQYRCLAIELATAEISVNLLMQIASFAATFKANRLHLILDDEFDPARQIPGVDSFVQTCESFGIALGVRVRWLGKILSGEKSVTAAWSGIRTLARYFGASHAALDDPCPEDASPEACQHIVDSLARGDAGIKDFSLDAGVLTRAEFLPRTLGVMGVSGFRRQWKTATPPKPLFLDVPLRIEVQAPLLGFSGDDTLSFFQTLDTATDWLRRRERRELTISFRDVGVSHLWQNMLYPAATGLVAAWGRPQEAGQCAWMFNALLYGDEAAAVMEMWNEVVAAFPPGLSPEQEKIVRRAAFGRWPEDEASRRLLAGVDWPRVAGGVRTAAEALKTVVANLNRNTATLSGAKLGLFALTWLHTFSVLEPELERRRRQKDDADGRTEPIARELYGNFTAWQGFLREVTGESGLELAELPLVESMGLRLKGLCEGIFE